MDDLPMKNSGMLPAFGFNTPNPNYGNLHTISSVHRKPGPRRLHSIPQISVRTCLQRRPTDLPRPHRTGLETRPHT
jgi:hypothetical protein